MPRSTRRLISMTTVLIMTFVFVGIAPAAANHEQDDAQHDFVNSHYEERWSRTDLPVIIGQVNRTWMWGPSPYTGGIDEPYAEAANGVRQVQYFDKSRMEINHDPAITPENVWYVTNGLLVVEMVSGWYQIGDNTFDESPEPSTEFIAGDPNVPSGVTYADIDRLGLRERPALLPGTTITLKITDDGQIIGEGSYSGYGVTAAHRVTVEGIDHTVASVFWDFMQSSGMVWEDGELVNADLFINPFYATGYPITDAFWSEFYVDGVKQPVLFQCFERRCLTYTPGNDPGWEVEAGNVGQHYYRWRHGDGGPQMESVNIFLVNEGAATEADPGFGCGDLLAPVNVQIVQQSTTEGRVAAALNRLFSYRHASLGNAFEGSSLSVQAVAISGDTATIDLTGSLSLSDDCDKPRATEQITKTVREIAGVSQVVIRRDGGPLIAPLAGGVVATFSVNGEQFKAWVTNPETINAILALRDGDTSVGTIPNALIKRGTGEANHNQPWSWHLDPQEIVMMNAAEASCDGNPSQVEANLDTYVDSVKRYCPHHAQLVDVADYR
jgi:hypothetical protein